MDEDVEIRTGPFLFLIFEGGWCWVGKTLSFTTGLPGSMRERILVMPRGGE